MKRRLLLLVINFIVCTLVHAQQIVADKLSPNSFSINNVTIYVDANDITLVKKSAALFQQDVAAVTGNKLQLINDIPTSKNIIIIGSIENSSLIKQLIQQKKINVDSVKNKWEAYQIQTIKNPFKGIENALVIVGSDRRGVAFGVMEISKQIGVSPWYWWADVPIQKKTSLFINKNIFITDAPKVKYRGIFINDEAPALSNWSKEKFGGFNHQFYAKVFELMLRLKANYIWPAMWGNAFYDDDSLNIKTADEYGIVIGTSHHEPLMRAHDEWRRYGKNQKWNYDSSQSALKDFWRTGMQRAANEKIVSIGMRGDGDEPMSRETATALLERIVKDQREIINDVTGKPAQQTPQLWALYKEVQDYYDKGMRVPDDVTLLLCDDNWGNIRRLSKLNEPARKGGYGIYYHFDYVGGPRNYKWINTNPIPRVWEQMHLAYEYNARQIWIVNVGDIKPMEFPISFFLDYAWNPEKIGANDLRTYTQNWAAAQFGEKYAFSIADIIAKYGKYNGIRKPELLDADTYSFDNYHEFANVVESYNSLSFIANHINKELPVAYRNAFFQLVMYPVEASANLNEMYYYVALNRKGYENKFRETNEYANKVKQLFIKDSLLSLKYHQLNRGKWNHMMDQTHIGYTYWQQPPFNKIPEVKYLSKSTIKAYDTIFYNNKYGYDDDNKFFKKNNVPKGDMYSGKFYESAGYVSIEANHYSTNQNTDIASIKVLPDFGRNDYAVTVFPVTAQIPNDFYNSPKLEYEMYVYDSGQVKLQTYFSPTLNFRNDEGLKYAIAIDDETPQVIAINKDDSNSKVWNEWVANNIIIKNSIHNIKKPGKHILKCWLITPGAVLQKIVVDFGGAKPSYFGPPETRLPVPMD